MANDGVERGDIGGRSVHLCGRDVCDHQANCGCLRERAGLCAVQLLIDWYWDVSEGGELARLEIDKIQGNCPMKISECRAPEPSV